LSSSVGDLISALNVGMTFRTLYFQEHPKVQRAAEEFVQILHELLEEREKDKLFLGIARQKLVVDGRPLLGATILARRLIDLSDRLCCGGFSFHKTVTIAEVLELISVHADIREKMASLEAARSRLASRGIKGIELSPPFGDASWAGNKVVPVGPEAFAAEKESLVFDAEDLRINVQSYQAMMATVEAAHEKATRGEEIDANVARGRAEDLVLKADDIHGLMHLSNYPDYDSYTIGHSVRVALLSVLVGSHCGYPRELLVELGTAGLLHDVGKSQIPHEVLFKNGALSEDERRIMSRHPLIGGQLLIESRNAGRLCVGAAFGHHIRFDRTGYPPLRPWAKTGKLTALVQVCDVFEALTAIRPYKRSLSPKEAYEIILRDGNAFDPAAVKVFCSAIGFYPPGARVELSDGSQGLVMKAGKSMSRPLVRINVDHEGHALPLEQSTAVDLSSPDHRTLRVRRIVPLEEVAA